MLCILPPERQKEWGWAASVNFFLGGTGAGYYLISFFMTNMDVSPQHIRVAPLAALLMMTGLLAVAWEAGRPLRGYRVFRGVAHAWMSRETVCFVLFLIFAAADRMVPASGWRIAMAVVALGFLICQAMVVHRSAAIEPWRSPLLVIMILSNALISGMGCILLFESLHGFIGDRYLIGEIALIFLNSVAWGLLVFRGPGRLRRRRLLMILKMGVGRIIPFVLIMLSLLIPRDITATAFMEETSILVGLALLIGSYSFNRWMIREAGMRRAVLFDESI